jgi:predicted DNA-binding protein
MPDELNNRLEKLAKEYGISKNTLINTACEDFLKTGRIDDLEKRVEAIEKELQKK